MSKKVVAFAGKQGCVDSDTEYLSIDGWHKISDYKGGPIGVYTTDGLCRFEVPLNYIVEPADKWYLFKKTSLDMKVSPEHNVWYTTSKGNLFHHTAEYLYNKSVKSTFGVYGNLIPWFRVDSSYELPYSDDYIRLLIAFQADGSFITIDSSDIPKVRFNLKKDRKKQRLESLLKSCNIDFTYTDAKDENSNAGFRTYYFYLPGAFKEFPVEWWGVSNTQLKLIAEEIPLWDGCFDPRTNNAQYFTTSKYNADFVQFVFTVVYNTMVSIYLDDRLNGIHKNVCYKVCVSSVKKLTMTKRRVTEPPIISVEEVKPNESKYCFTTSTGMWIMRRNNKILVTGNSGKDYHCQQLLKQGNYKKMAFADALRRIMFIVLGIPYDKGMEQYEELKQTPLYNGQTLRNMLEHLGTEGIRYYDNDFWAKCLIKDLDETNEDTNVCISDLRFYNEYKYLKDYCDNKGYEFSFIFCDYHSERYCDFNPHASARLANFLKEIGYKDGDEIKDEDMQIYIESMDALTK